MRILAALLLVLALALGARAAAVPAGEQEASAMRLTKELLGEEVASYYSYHIVPADADKRDFFAVRTTKRADGKVFVSVNGTTGVSLASGLNYFLKERCNSEVTWGEGDTWKQLSVSLPLPELSGPVVRKSAFRHRYYLNVCTVSYSMAWWNSTRWVREVDWAAMHGFNEILAFTGQEYPLREAFTKLGLKADAVQKWFAGPAFLAWGRMANIKSFPNGLDARWIEDQRALQVQILERMRSLGVIPILPAFAGFVGRPSRLFRAQIPEEMKALFPSMKTVRSSSWCGFNSSCSETLMVDPTDPKFPVIGKAILEEQQRAYGTDHYYNCDLFNEMSPPSGEASYLAAASKAVYDTMRLVDPEAVWVLQGWFFLNGADFWTIPRARAFLDSVPDERMLILDLSTDDRPQYSRLEGYFGKPWVFNELLNFGGRPAMYGNLDRTKSSLVQALASSPSLKGIGLTMEAIDNNPVVYEMTSDLIWEDAASLDVSAWLTKYAARRAGLTEGTTMYRKLVEAWQHLHRTTYSFTGSFYDVTFALPNSKPSPNPDQGLLWTNATDTLEVLRLLYDVALEAKATGVRLGKPFLNDLVDVGRQVLSNYFIDAVAVMNNAYKRRSKGSFESASALALGMLEDLDRLLNTDVNYQLGKWVNGAKQLGHGDAERTKYLIFNAKLQVSSWADFNGYLNDYAQKQWAGMMLYYRDRWSLYRSAILDDLNGVRPFDQGRFNDELFQKVDMPFFRSAQEYPFAPVGDTVDVLQSVVMPKYALTDLSSYTVKPDTDYNQCDLTPDATSARVYTRDPQQLAILCDAEPECIGFLSEGGYLKRAGCSESPREGATFFRKK